MLTDEQAALLIEEERYGSFPRWLRQISPEFCWHWAWQRHVQAVLKEVTAGVVRKLMLSLPPQHGKSSLVTERYSVYRLVRDPALRIIIGSYNKDFARRFGRRTRRLAEQAGIVTLSDRNTTSAQDEWETAQGGGIVSVGVGSGVTGRPGDLIIIDDPVKSREEAESKTYRERCWEWYTDDLFTRLQQHGSIILIMTRWHGDDLAGRILDSADGPNWIRVNLPADAEENDPLGRAPGEPLCPERYDATALAERREVLGSYGYSALYQGRPTPREGGWFKRDWFEIVPAAPATARRVRWWDLAATPDDGDFSVGTRMAEADGVFYVEDVVRTQETPGAVKRLVKQTAELDGVEVAIRMEQEPGSSGKAVIADYARWLAGYAFKGIPSTGSKEVRADPFAAQAEAGNVKLVKGPWNRDWLEEICAFNKADHDDQVDSASGCFGELTKPDRRAKVMVRPT